MFTKGNNADEVVLVMPTTNESGTYISENEIKVNYYTYPRVKMPKNAADADKAVAILTKLAHGDKDTLRRLHNEDGSVKKLSEVIFDYPQQLSKAKSEEQRAEMERICDRPCIENDGVAGRDFEISTGRGIEWAAEERAVGEAVVEMVKDAGVEVHFISQAEARQKAAEAGKVNFSKGKKRALETAYEISKDTHHSTVVSSADGAKILKNIDSTIEKYENKDSNRTKTFIGDIAAALGAERSGSKSEYATFETKNGRV